jgi:hypothetical protein
MDFFLGNVWMPIFVQWWVTFEVTVALCKRRKMIL